MIMDLWSKNKKDSNTIIAANVALASWGRLNENDNMKDPEI